MQYRKYDKKQTGIKKKILIEILEGGKRTGVFTIEEWERRLQQLKGAKNGLTQEIADLQAEIKKAKKTL